MKTIEKLGFQGDVAFIRVDGIPEGTEEDTARPVVVAHSETGHHHEIHQPDVALLRDKADPFTCYLRVAGDFADVVHLRTTDTHETVRLGKGDWMVRRQREHTPEGWRMVMD